MATSIECRLATLERSNRRLQLTLLGLACACAVGVVLGMNRANSVPDVIRAKRFEVLNAEGATVVELDSWELGGVINARNNESVTVVKLRAWAHGGWIQTMGPNGDDLFQAAATPEGDALVQAFNRDAQALVVITANEEGTGTVVTYNSEEAESVQLTSNEHGGMVTTNSGAGAELVRLGTDKDGNGVVLLYDTKGELIRALHGRN